MPSSTPDRPPDPDEESRGEDLDFEIAFYEGIAKKLPNSVDLLMALGNNYTRRGRHEDGLAIDRQLCRLRSNDPIVHYNLACSYSLLSRLDESLEALRRAIALGYADVANMGRDPDLESLRNDPRYAALLESVLRQQPTS